jgi:UDP-N-acetylmuramoyl-L-alanyl-D-glutamate--2,6-diaminopimelate ligase
MQLTELLNSVKAISVVGEVQRQDVSGIFYDSRKVTANSIFVAIAGFNTDGHNFILDALNKGAIAVVVERNELVPDEVFIHQKAAKIFVQNSRKALSQLSAYFYKNPSKLLNVIGITGTNGKTTTSYYIKTILEEAGNKVGLIGTIANYIGQEKIESKLTTPESSDLNELLYKMYLEKCSYAVMEVSSHSLVLNRVENINFSQAVFTNITSDHLDFHHTFENYLQAKKILFDSLTEESFSIVNKDDFHHKDIVAASQSKIITYGSSVHSDFTIKDVVFDLSGTRFKISHNSNQYIVTTSLIGEFNAYNASAAFAVGILSGLNPEVVISGIKNTPQVPGRFEVIGEGKKKVIVDYSHTADSLEKTLLAIKKIVNSQTAVYTVFGCGGNRDKLKRPIMGRVASELSKKCFITSDNPRFEDPLSIIDEIKTGIENNNYETIENREEAIKKAIESTEPNSVILIAGKGHENYQEIKGVRNHFSDKEIALKYLAK